MGALLMACLASCAGPQFLQPSLHPFDYNTVEELIGSILNDFTEEQLQKMFNGRVEAEKDREAFRNFITMLQDGFLYVPYYQGREMTFRNRDGFHNISFFPSDRYGKPWIWYYPDTGQQGNSFISVMYLDENLKAEANERGAYWLISQIAPQMPTPENYKKIKDYSRIFESTIELNGRTFSALVYQFTDDPRDHTFFVYDDVLVRITYYPGETATEWLKGLSFEKIPLRGE